MTIQQTGVSQFTLNISTSKLGGFSTEARLKLKCFLRTTARPAPRPVSLGELQNIQLERQSSAKELMPPDLSQLSVINGKSRL